MSRTLGASGTLAPMKIDRGLIDYCRLVAPPTSVPSAERRDYGNSHKLAACATAGSVRNPQSVVGEFDASGQPGVGLGVFEVV